MTRRPKAIKAYIAVVAFFSAIAFVTWVGPLDGWQLLLGILIAMPFSFWILKATLEYHGGDDYEINQAAEERLERQHDAAEKYRIYEENYQREGTYLKTCVLDVLKAIARGEKQRLDYGAIEAARKIMERQGINNPGMAENHPEIVELWTVLIHELCADSLKDPKAIQDRLADLLWPETLEDVDALKRRVKEGLAAVTEGRQARLDRDALEAAKTLNEIRERDARKTREEWELEAAAIRKEKEARGNRARITEQMAKSDARSSRGNLRLA